MRHICIFAVTLKTEDYSFFVANTLYKLLSKLVAFYLYRNSIFLGLFW